MKTPISACFQISAYSEKVAKNIATRIRETIKDGEEPSESTIEESMGSNEGWPQEPEVYIFFDMEEEDYVNSDGIPAKIVNAIASENVQLWVLSGENLSSWAKTDFLLEAKPPESVQQHVQWTGISLNMYQHIYTSRKVHPYAEEYKCNEPTCKEKNTWYSLPENFELARLECPSCNKLGQRIF
jgi:hypothetical protein